MYLLQTKAITKWHGTTFCFIPIERSQEVLSYARSNISCIIKENL